MSDIQVIRQLLLDLLTEYQQLEKPANPELLRLHIEAYEDRVEALIQEQVRLARIDELEWLQNKHKEETNDGWNEPSTPLITYVVMRKHIIKKESE